MSIILSGLIHLFRPLLSSLSGALDCEGLGPWYFLLGLRIVAIFFANGPWDKAKEDVACNWGKPLDDSSLAFCTALCHNQHFAISISATWGLVFLLCLLYVGLMRLSSPEEKKEETKEKEKSKEEKEKDKGLAVVATAPHSGVADISTVYNVGPRGLTRRNGYGEDDDDGDYDLPHHLHHPYWAHWHRSHMGHMGEGYGPMVPYSPYESGGYGGGAYGMPGAGGYGVSGPRGYGMPAPRGYGMPGPGGYGMSDEGGYGMPAEGGFTVLAEEGHSAPPSAGHSVPPEGGPIMSDDGGRVMPDDEGRSVPAGEGCGVSANGGYNVPADGGYSLPIHPENNGRATMPAYCYNTAQRKMTAHQLLTHQHDSTPIHGRMKQAKAASRCDEKEHSKVPTKSVPVPINSSPYKRKYKKATKCRPVLESDMDSKGNAFQPWMDDRANMALKRRQVHGNNVPSNSKNTVAFGNKAPPQPWLGKDSDMAAQGGPSGGWRMTPGPGIPAGSPSCCHDNACCPCAENTSCHSTTHCEHTCQPCCSAESYNTKPGDSAPGVQEKAKKVITNLCGIPFFDIWVGFLLGTEIAFLCSIIVLQMPSLLARSWVCRPGADSCPQFVECVVRGRAEKRVALWGLVLTCGLFIIACSGYFYIRTCWNRRCCKCCGEETQENRGAVTNNEPEGWVMRGDVESGNRETGGRQQEG